jgi:hypothetical protein
MIDNMVIKPLIHLMIVMIISGPNLKYSIKINRFHLLLNINNFKNKIETNNFNIKIKIKINLIIKFNIM